MEIIAFCKARLQRTSRPTVQSKMQSRIQLRGSLMLTVLSVFALTISAAHAEPRSEAPPNDAPIVAISTTMGSFSLELYPQHAPATVANFLQYVDQGFYNDVIFHRVMEGFVIQAGGFDAQRQERETGQSVKNESIMGPDNDRGTLAMARTSHPDSARAQFYINLKDNNFLNSHNTTPGYTVFGKVISGMTVIDKISAVKTTDLGGPFSAIPLEPVIILNAQRVSRNSDNDPAQR